MGDNPKCEIRVLRKNGFYVDSEIRKRVCNVHDVPLLMAMDYLV